MKSFLTLDNRQPETLPVEFQEDDVRYSPELVKLFLEEFTQSGNVVFDPFVGYGTTLLAAEALERQAYGIELNERRVRYARNQLKHPENLFYGDARRLLSYPLPAIDFSMTSPPFTSKDDALDPLTDYSLEGKGYATYLREIKDIYAQLRSRMRPAGTAVIEVANIKRNGRVTTLAWDIAAVVSQVLHFEGEVVIGWDRYGYGYEHSYCLVFTAL